MKVHKDQQSPLPVNLNTPEPPFLRLSVWEQRNHHISPWHPLSAPLRNPKRWMGRDGAKERL